MIDTNVMIELLHRKITQSVRPNIQAYSCSIVLGELYFGARKSLDPVRQTKEVNALIMNMPNLDCDKDTAIHYSLIRHMLESSGGRIPENDMWIAALALQHQLTLVTRDAHFARLPNLTIEAW